MHRRPTSSFISRSRLAVGTLTAVAVLGCGLSAAAATSVQFSYDHALRLSRHQDDRLLPVSVTGDALGGELVVTDSAWSALHVFNVAGVEVFRTEGFAGLVGPLDGTVDHEGRLVALSMVDGGRRTIVRLDAYGEPEAWLVESPHADWSPDHLLVARDGNYVTVDGSAGLLVKHDADSGAVIWATVIATPDPDDPGLETAIGRPVQRADGTYALPGGNLHNVVLVDENGAVTASFGRFGSSPGRLVTPVAVAEGPQGTLLVLDQMRHKILVFDGQQQFVSEFGSIGDAPGAFYYPVSMAADGAGHVYVAQGYRGRVQVFNVLVDGAIE